MGFIPIAIFVKWQCNKSETEIRNPQKKPIFAHARKNPNS